MPTTNASISLQWRSLGWEVDHLYLEDLPGLVARRPFDYTSFAAAAALRIKSWERQRGRYDVIQVSGGDGYLAPLLRGRGSGRRLLVARCHGLEHRSWEAHQRAAAEWGDQVTARHRLYFGGLRLKQVELTIRACDLFNCHTEADADYVVDRGWKRRDEVRVIPSGIEEPWFGLPIAERPTGRRILWLGSWSWMKGPGTLAATFAALCAHDPQMSLTMLGTGVDTSTVVSRFPPELRSRVTVRPSLQHSEVLTEMTNHDLLLATSQFEGFGTAVIEAMAAGLPVVASAVGGANDYVEDGRTGYVVRPGDVDGFVRAVEVLLSQSSDRLLEVRRAARDSVRDLTWDRIAGLTLAAYVEQLLILRP
jgi:glycosyltransferase involved in cell wall biosynthesis